jgi:N-acetylneuraminic acid mutarotase
MTRSSPPPIGFTLGLLALVACDETTTGPERSGGLSSRVASLSAASDSWVARADMPRKRDCCAAAAATSSAAGSVLYFMGGLTSSQRIPSTVVQAYDVATDTWSLKAPLPVPLYGTNGAEVIRGKIYISGGVGIAGKARATLFRYDPATDTWTTKASMPTDTEGGVSGVINNELYVLTGCSPTFDCDEGAIPMAFYRYSPVTDTWTTLPNPALTLRPRKAAVIGGKFYTFGGDNRRQIRVYDPATNRWTGRVAIPGEHAPRVQSQRVVVLGDKLYLVGGVVFLLDDTYRPFPTSVYDPATQTWTHKAAMPVAQPTLAATRVVVDGEARIEVLSGEPLPGPGRREPVHRNWQYIP